MAAIVKFLRPSGEPVYVNADHVVVIMAAPGGRSSLQLVSDRFQSIEVDIDTEGAAEILTSAASGFVVTTAERGAEPAGAAEQEVIDAVVEPVGEDQTPLNAT